MIKPVQAPKSEKESARGFALEEGAAGVVEEAGRRTCVLLSMALDGREARTNLGR
jgi:hypothetical protein